MIQPLCPPVRCYLTASYLLSSFPDAGSPHLHTPSFVGSLVEEELLSSTTTTTTVFLRLCLSHGAELIAAFLTSIHCRVPADDVGMNG